MDENSAKPVENGNARVFSLKIAHEWLEREGNRQKIPTALGVLLEATLKAAARGDPPPAKDAASMVDGWRLEQQSHRDAPANPSATRSSEFNKWWDARAGHLRQTCLDNGCHWLPRLVVQPGGGRGNPTLYRFELDFLELVDADAEGPADDADDVPSGGLRYRIDPLRPPLWLRLLIGSRPFPINSWRGYVLLGSAVLNFILIGAILWTVWVKWFAVARPVTTNDIAQLAVALGVSTALWRLTRPVRDLPAQRVTLANASFLRGNDFYGQLRAMREGRSRQAGRMFSLVRHWGTCPVCAAEVDLADGGSAFPGRIVGRCGDAPLEHVYSFDPVRLVGVPLARCTPA